MYYVQCKINVPLQYNSSRQGRIRCASLSRERLVNRLLDPPIVEHLRPLRIVIRLLPLHERVGRQEVKFHLE